MGRKKKEKPDDGQAEVVQQELEIPIEEKGNYDHHDYHSKMYGIKGRYVASLQSPTVKNCYIDFVGGDVLKEVKEQAYEESLDAGRPIIIFDRKNQEFVERFNPETEE